jgi:proton-translocating NADH-quinone oxidoreductase chain M
VVDYALSLILFIPLIGAALTLLFTKSRESARIVALIASAVPLILAVMIYLQNNPELAFFKFQFVEKFTWISSLGINYYLGVDGVSMPLILLNAILCPLTVIYAWGENKLPNQFFALILVLQAGVFGVFMALDFFLFYIFWELTLIPLYFLISIWGGPNKDYAAIKFFIYTHVASLVMVLGIFALYFSTGANTFEIPVLLQAFSDIVSPEMRAGIFLALFFGFLVKMPTVPFHTWLPDAHVEAPTAGSVLLAGVLLKMGGYGLFRVLLPMIESLGPYRESIITLMAILAVLSILYATFVALAQRDLKKMVAYSSVAHMGYVMLGAAAFNSLSVSGAMFQQFSHGLITAVLFMSVGVIQHTVHTRIIADLGGLADRMPKLAFLMMGGFMASLGLPAMSGFVAEFLVLTGSYVNPEMQIYVLLAMLGIVATAGYHLWAMQRAMFGSYNEKLGNPHDLAFYEMMPMAILVLLIILFGLFPAPVINVFEYASTIIPGVEVII